LCLFLRHSYLEPVPLTPGDEIRVNCVYDSRSRKTTTSYGEATTDEMCIGFLTIYPAVKQFDRCYTWKDLPVGCQLSTLLSHPRCNFPNFLGLLNLTKTKCDTNCSRVCGCLDGTVGEYVISRLATAYPALQPTLTLIKNYCAPLWNSTQMSTYSTMSISETTRGSVSFSADTKSPPSVCIKGGVDPIPGDQRILLISMCLAYFCVQQLQIDLFRM